MDVGSRLRSGSSDHISSSRSNNHHSTNISSSNASRHTRPDRCPSLEREGVPGEHLLLLLTKVMLKALRFCVETPSDRERVQGL